MPISLQPARQALAALLSAAAVFAAPFVHADPLSYSHPEQVKTTDLYLDLKADFNRRILSGYAELTLDWLDKSAHTLVLDTNELNIAKVQMQMPNGRWAPASYLLDKLDTEK